MAQNAASFTALLASAFLAVGQFAEAGEHGGIHPQLDSTYSFDVGIFYPDRSNRLRADGSIGFEPEPDPHVDFESEFKNKQSDEVFSAQLGWQYHERWKLLMQYFDSRISNSATLSEDVEWIASRSSTRTATNFVRASRNAGRRPIGSRCQVPL